MIAESIIILLSMCGIGLIAGFIGSILGIGGGLIVTPLLTIMLGLDIKYAIAASIIVVIATCSGSAIAYLKDNVVNLRVAMFFEIFTTIGGLIGALVTGCINAWMLYFIFSGLLVFSALNMLKKILTKNKAPNINMKTNKLSARLNLDSSYYDKSKKQLVSYKLCRIPLGASIMLCAGFFSGLLGIGSGIFKVIAMDVAMKMPIKPSNATSNLMMGVTAAASALVYFFSGTIIPEITVPVVIGVIFGSTIGSKIMPKLPDIWIRILFITTAVLLCSQMITKAVLAIL